jgi:hypothetical protein
MYMAVFWVLSPFSVVDVLAPCFIRVPDVGHSKQLKNTGELLPDYMVLQLRKQSYSFFVWYPYTFHLNVNSYRYKCRQFVFLFWRAK